MDSVGLGLVALVVGSLVAVLGFRLFYYALGAFAFLAGFLGGVQIVHAAFGGGLLTTLLGWVAGVAGGVVLAGLTLAWFWIGVVVVVGALAAAVVGGLLHLLGLGGGALAVVLELAAAIGVGLLAVRYDAPTAIIGAACAVGGSLFACVGLFLLTGAMSVDELADGPLAPFATRPVAFVAWGLVAIALAVWQVSASRRFGLEPRLGHGARPATEPASAAGS